MKGNQILVLFRLKIPRSMEKKQGLGTNKKVATKLNIVINFLGANYINHILFCFRSRSCIHLSTQELN